MRDIDSVSLETQALLLLCGSLGQRRAEEVKPLTPSEFYQLAQWLKQNDLNLSDLLTPRGLRQLQDLQSTKPDSGRVITLLERGGVLALSLEDWYSKGIWVLSRYDEEYPCRLAERLGRAAPLLLYGVGSIDLMSAGGLAIVGSRDVDNDGIEFTRQIAGLCAKQDIQVISGGARGVDTEAMLAALESGGRVVGVLADSLVRTAVSGKFRRGILDGNLLLISPYRPDAGFSIGSAMGRNKYIYGLSDWALVISTSSGTGGTWAGAVENLKNGWAPLFVRTGDGVPEGNRVLIENGGLPMSRDVLKGDAGLRDWLDSQVRSGCAADGISSASPAQLPLLE